jgi:two-component system CitB family response regulator/two-component system response regulator DcuR
VNPLRVLIIEDDPRIADLHRRFTEKVEGFTVVGVATDLTEAEEQVAVLEPDLVLLDLYLHEGSGLDLLQRLRSEGRQIDAILITAARETETLQEALRGGVFDYIIKPVVFSRFEESLGKFAAFRDRLGEGARLEQEDVDRLLRSAPAADGPVATGDLPKGIQPLTLAKVKALFEAETGAVVSAEEAAARLGVSRSTARRYLEYLVTAGLLEADVNYGAVGRPERRYRRR